jgi:hypothetical protein
MKKVLLLSGLLITAGLYTMAQTHHPKKDTASAKPVHVKSPKKTTDTTHHNTHNKKH